ncbi:MAG: hypothetical protein GOV15_02950 [Candidatus Diapherotrites archaeon]|nr:hypothetical protein [Candidatus Diapherotrites archaeon]
MNSKGNTVIIAILLIAVLAFVGYTFMQQQQEMQDLKQDLAAQEETQKEMEAKQKALVEKEAAREIDNLQDPEPVFSSEGQVTNIDVENNAIYVKTRNNVSTVVDSVYVDGVRTCELRVSIPASGETIGIGPILCPGLELETGQDIVVTGTNNFRVVGKS